MAFPWMTAASIGSSVLGGVLGSKSERKAASMQRDLLRQATGTLDEAMGFLPGDQDDVLAELDAANMVLAGIEPAVLEGMDEQLRVRVAQQVMTSQQEAEAQQQRLAQGGLDSTTVAPAMQRGQRLGQAQQVGGVAAQFAGQRSNMIFGARQAHAGGLARRAGVVESFSQRRQGLMQDKANMFFGTQIQPSNVGASIGALGGSITNAMYTEGILKALKEQGED